MKKRKNRKCNCNQNVNCFEDFELPPCSKFLGSDNPLINDGRIIYRNFNRFYFFLTFNSSELNDVTYDPLKPETYNSTGNGNLQIEPYYFFIGLYINCVEKGKIKYDVNEKIHEDDDADGFIKNVLENEYTIGHNFIPSLTYIIGNSSAVIPMYTGNIQISPINYYIILMLNRAYGNYGMLYSNNAYITNDFINRTLASMYFEV